MSNSPHLFLQNTALPPSQNNQNRKEPEHIKKEQGAREPERPKKQQEARELGSNDSSPAPPHNNPPRPIFGTFFQFYFSAKWRYTHSRGILDPPTMTTRGGGELPAPANRYPPKAVRPRGGAHPAQPNRGDLKGGWFKLFCGCC